MFKIESHRRTISNLPIIAENYEVIHFDEIPYLYYGTNKYGTKIIGSLLYEDEESNELRYVHTLVDNITFNSFVNQDISYRSVIENGSDVFIIDKNINEKPIAIFSLSPDLIPDKLLPVPDYFCPNYNFSIGNDFVLSLHGNIADAHLAFPVELSRLQEKFEKVLTRTLGIFDNLNILPVIKQRAYTPGSFQLRFNLSFVEYKEIFIEQGKLYNSIGNILRELIPSLNSDLSSEKAITNFVENESLIELIKDTLKPGAISVTDEFVLKTKNKFEDIITSYNDLASNIGNGYSEIELLAEKKNSKDLIPLSLITDKTMTQFVSINDQIESNKYVIETDDDFKKYKVSIYALNTDTRSGKALIYNRDDNESMDKPTIKISGSDSLDKSRYTESLHLNKWIEVNAKATLKNGNYSKLSIDYD